MRLAALLLFVAAVCGLGYYVFSHPGLDQLEELEGELAELEAQNEKLADRNAQLEREILALRDDPRLAERRARESVGLARPDELLVQFDEAEEETSLQMRLDVDPDGLELAGRSVGLGQLAGRLEKLHAQIPHATLRVEFDDEVGPIRRRQIREIVDDAPLNAVVDAGR